MDDETSIRRLRRSPCTRAVRQGPQRPTANSTRVRVVSRYGKTKPELNVSGFPCVLWLAPRDLTGFGALGSPRIIMPQKRPSVNRSSHRPLIAVGLCPTRTIRRFRRQRRCEYRQGRQEPPGSREDVHRFRRLHGFTLARTPPSATRSLDLSIPLSFSSKLR